jgi:hypothetical protein
VNAIGAVLVNLTGISSRKEMLPLVSEALVALPEGRNVIVMWEQDSNWGPRIPMESWVTQEICGQPNARTSSEIDFFGNGVVRIYKSRQTTPTSTWQWLSFRRQGEKAYVRRKSVTADLLEAGSISTLDPVFTRDAANNVWHMTSQSSQTKITSRFQVLLTWPDEDTLVITNRASRRIAYPLVSFSEGLIGVADKTPYQWD